LEKKETSKLSEIRENTQYIIYERKKNMKDEKEQTLIKSFQLKELQYSENEAVEKENYT